MASVDSIEDNTGFAQKNEATFPVLADPEKTTARAYGVLSQLGYAKRWTFYIDPEGIVVKIDRDVDPRRAGEHLVTHLEALGVPELSPDGPSH